MTKIRNKNFTVSPAKFINGVVHLLEVDELAKTGSHLTGYIQEEDSLRKSFDQDTGFFYTLETFDSLDINSRKLTRKESGIARVKKSRDTFFLDRETALSSIESEEVASCAMKDTNGCFILPDDTSAVIGSYIPTNYIDLFYRNHSIICSTDELSPSPVELTNNSVLGRLDGEIQALDSDDISLIISPDYVVKTLQSNSDPILISSDHFELTSSKSKLLLSQMVLKPRSKPRNKEQGLIFYNKSTNSLEFFDGTKWRKIKTED